MKKTISTLLALLMLFTSVIVPYTGLADDDEITRVSRIDLSIEQLPQELGDKNVVKNVKVYNVEDSTYEKISNSKFKVKKAYITKSDYTDKWFKQKALKDKTIAGNYNLVIVLKATDSNVVLDDSNYEVTYKVKGSKYNTWCDTVKFISDTEYAICFRCYAYSVSRKGVSYYHKKNKTVYAAIDYNNEKKYKNKTLTILSNVKGYKVTALSSYAFAYTKIKGVKIPKTVTEIGYNAFSYCSKLTSLNIPKNVKKIEGSPCRSAYKLKSIGVAKGSKYFKSVNGVLYNKKRTVLVQYPAGKKGKKFYVPSGVRKIDVGAFEGCNKLTELTLPKSVKTINSFAFRDCDNLKKIVIPSGSKLEKIEYFALGLKYDEKKEKYVSSGVKVYTKSAKVKKAIKKYNKEVYKNFRVKNCVKIK